MEIKTILSNQPKVTVVRILVTLENNMKMLAIVNILGWATFILVDHAWNKVISEAVLAGQKTYGELFGSLSFFRPLALYGSLLITLILSGAVIINLKTKNRE